MAVLSDKLPGTRFKPYGNVADDNALEVAKAPEAPEAPDDISGRVHRRLIGSVGILMPLLVLLIAGVFPNDPAHRWELLGSISSYYYTAAVSSFVGLLIALSLYLFAYRGYANKWQLLDTACSRIAAVAALGVAAFPTSAPTGLEQPHWWAPWMRLVHYGSTIFLFSMFAVFCFWLFRLTDPDGKQPLDKSAKGMIYVVCGIAIVGGMIWAIVAGVVLNGPIFLPESVMLVAFATSWLVKGAIQKPIVEAIKGKKA